jgi:hypothetical protein
VAEIITSADLPTDVAANAMSGTWVDGANARASRVAPCLASTDPAPTADQLAEAKLVLIGAIIRWSQAGAGAFQSQTAGPFGVTLDTRQRVGYNLWPSEITQLQDICKSGAESQAFSFDTVGTGSIHSPICSLYFGSEDCSCGASLAGQPIYEV